MQYNYNMPRGWIQSYLPPRCVRYGAYYEVMEINPKEKTMSKIGNMMKRLLDADTQTLVKAGYINGDLELTDAGKRALWAIIFTANKAELVTEAQAEIDAEKK